jgi:murein L,D-transpeptidase YafK
MNSPDNFAAARALANAAHSSELSDVSDLSGVSEVSEVSGVSEGAESARVDPAAFNSLNSLLDQDQAAKARGKRRSLVAVAALLAAGAAAFWWFKPDQPVATNWLNETVKEVRLNSNNLVASGNDSKRLTVVPPESLLKREPRRSSPDEARLLEVYGLLASGDGEQAFQKAQRLAVDAPGFALAQLLYADLLSAQAQPAGGFGAATSEVVTVGRERLDELTDEARVRVQAASVMPSTGLVPSALVSLSPNVKHAVAVDVARSRLYVFENGSQGLSLIREYYASIGKNGMVKQVAGDQRTPLGVYFVTKQIPSATLPSKYGKQALALNYPNPYDRLQGRGGDGIWLHGIPPGMYSRAPWATDGCIALANHYLQELSAYIDVQATPIVVAERLEWVKPAELTTRHAAFLGEFEKWQQARKQNDAQVRDAFYSTSVNLPEAEALGPPWREQLREEHQRRANRRAAAATAVETAPDHLSIISWQDRDALMVVTFTETEPGDKRPRTRRQYWIQEPVGWRIFYERSLV